MHKIGMMQGRILPDRLDKLQVFPAQRWREEFKEAKKIGFDYIELLYDRDESDSNPLVNIDKNSEIIQITEETGTGIFSICADYFTKVNLMEENDNIGRDKLTFLIDYAQKLNLEKIIIPFFDKNTPDSQKSLIRFLKYAEEEIERASKFGLEILIETSLPAKEMLDAVKRTSSKAKICYDFGNATAKGYSVEDEISLLAGSIGLVHIKDRIKGDGPNVFLGKGDVDFKEGFEALKAINYSGNFTLETAIGEEPLKFAEKHLAEVKKYLKELM